MAVNIQDYVGIGIDPEMGKRHEIKYLPKDAAMLVCNRCTS